MTSRRAARTPAAPRAGSMLANGMTTSEFSAASSAISSLVGSISSPVCEMLSTPKAMQAMSRSR